LMKKFKGIVDGEHVVIKMEQDELVDSPIHEDYFISKLACWHGRYSLGHKHNFSDGAELLQSLLVASLSEDKKKELFHKIFPSTIVYNAEEEVYEIKSSRKELEDEYFDTKEEALEFIESEVDCWIDEDDLLDSFESRDEVISLIEESYVILPLYLYDHGGITMKTSPFNDPWDSGQVGWAYAHKDKYREETGYTENELFSKDKKRIPLTGECVKLRGHESKGIDGFGLVQEIDEDKVIVNFDYNVIVEVRKEENIVEATMDDVISVRSDMARKDMEGEVRNYDQYLRGDVYWFSIEKIVGYDDDGEKITEVIDSCGGFYGDNPFENGMVDHMEEKYVELLKKTV
jgi:hypothetical protein